MVNAVWRAGLVAVLLLVVTPHQLPVTEQAKRRKMEIEMCDFDVPKNLAQARATFMIVYELQLDGGGRPTKVEKLKMENDLQFSDERFVRCIKGWILPGVNQRAFVALQWIHGKGWTQIEISGSDFDYIIKVQPGAFSYP